MAGLKRKDMDMTSGVIWKQLLSFSFPLMVGNLFQLLYNTVDSIVVGQFVGKTALAAVGSVGPIMNTLIGFFMGLSAGAGVVISQCYGARDGKGVHDAVHASIFMTLVMSVLFTVIGVLMVPLMLNLMSTPEDVMEGATSYLTIYFAGVTGLMFYNMGSGILRAIGDSRRPLYFLIVSAVTNTILDIVFVVVLGMGIEGVAYATIIAQFLSALLTIYVLLRSEGDYKLILRHVRFDGPMTRRILKIGTPTALQMAVTAFSNVFVQGYINHFGSACMAGWSSYSKLDQFIMLPMQAVALGATTFAGQNFGAGNIARAKRGTLVAVLISEISTVILMIPVILFAPQLVYLFNTDEEVISYGTLFIDWLTPFYVCCVINQVYAGTLRGVGETKAPMFIMLGSFVVFRQIYLYFISQVANTEVWVGLGYPFGWILCSSLCLAYYYLSGWEKKPFMKVGKSK